MTNGGPQMQHIRLGRLLAVCLAMACLVVLGIGSALLVHVDSRPIKFGQATLFAASTASYEITTPISLGAGGAIRIQRGTVQLAPTSAQRRTGDPVDIPPQDGSASLIIDGGVFHIAGGGLADDIRAANELSPFEQALRTVNFERVAIHRGTVRVHLPSGHAETLTNVAAEVTVRRKSSLSIRGTGSLRGQEISFDIAGPSLLDRRPNANRALKVAVKSPFLDISFDGRLGATDTMRLQGQADISTSNLRHTARWLGAGWPAGPGLREMRLRGDVDWQAPALAFDKASFQIDGNEATGTLALGFNAPRPSLSGTLAFQTLNLSPYLEPELKAQIASLLPWFGDDDGEIPLPLGRQIDADIRLSASRVLLPGLETGRFAAAVSLREGRLLADIAEINIDGGRGSGQLTADLNDRDSRLSIRGRIEGIEAERASTLLLGHSVVTGTSTITADLSAGGNTVSELVRGLRGKATLSLREGGRLGIDIKSLMGAAQKSKVEGWELATRGQTSIDGLEAKFRVDKGIVASEHVEATVGDSLLKAVGTISLASRQLDLRLLLDAAPAAAARAQVAIPPDILLFQGPWSAPSIQIER